VKVKSVWSSHYGNWFGSCWPPFFSTLGHGMACCLRPVDMGK
jgi:hypothetical protein